MDASGGRPVAAQTMTDGPGVARGAGGWLGAVPVALAATDPDGRIVHWDPVAEQLLGYRARDAVGRHVVELLHPDADRSLGRSLWEGAAAGHGVMGSVTAWHRDGRPVELEIWARPAGAGAEPGVLVFAAEAHSSARVRGSSVVWDGLFSHSPVGIAVFDTGLRFLRVNAALQRMNGLPEAAHAGLTLPQVLPEVNAREMEAVMRRVLDTGEPVVDFRRVGRTPAQPRRDGVWSVAFVRLEDAEGLPVGIAASMTDITAVEGTRMQAEEARARLALLNEASIKIGTTLDLERTAQELADVAVPGLADVVTVDLLESLAEGGEVGDGLVGGAALRRLGKAPRAGSLVAGVLAPLDRTLQFPAAAPYSQALARRRPYLLTHLDEKVVAAAAPYSDTPRKLLLLGVRSFLMVPLIAREKVLGLATFYRTGEQPPFDGTDVELAGELAARAAVCADNARLYGREHDTAVALQRSMLPQHITPPAGIEIAHRYLAASDVNEVGGDWYDVVSLSGGKAALLIGDVMGHGTAAAAVMGRLSSTVRALARLDLEPVEVLMQLEAVLADLAEPMLATFLYAMCDPATGRCRITRAGHPPPAVVTPDGRARLLDLPAGAPLGIGGITFTTSDVSLPPGSLLVLYTDGLVEARGTDIDARLEELTRRLADPGPSLDDLCDVIVTRLVPGPPADDVALLVARIGTP
ncbi:MULTISPECIES: SpoIIE family protein phosphatase [unclassified Streptomyces]|uniref:SpoIIE family protein phosphatase n=1 Tax=unclassified Streptomyces TaxID=2593676 RepID=UPI0033B8B938